VIPAETASYTWQPLDSERIPAVRQLFAAAGQPVPPPRKIQGLLATLGHRAANHTCLAMAEDGTAVALGLVLPQNNGSLLDVILHPAHRSQEIGRILIDTLLTGAGAQTGTSFPVRSTASDEDQFLCDLFLASGFQVQFTQIRMRRDLQRPLPSIDLPDGIQVIPYAPEYDEAMRIAFNAAFTDHWIGELDTTAWRQRFTATPQFAPELSGVAVTGNDVVGIYLSENLDKDTSEAWLEILGVVSAWRGHGLGAALASYVLRQYRACGYSHAGLDVDLENSTNAIRLYEKLGFGRIKGTLYFHKSAKQN